MFVHGYLDFSEAALKCGIVGKGDNYKYLVALYTHQFKERFTFCFFFLQFCFWAIYDMNLLLVTFRVVLHDVHADNYHVLDVMGRG